MSALKQIVFAAALVAAATSLRADIIWSGDQAIHLSYALLGDEPPQPGSFPEGEYRTYLNLDLNGDDSIDLQIGDIAFSSWFYANSDGNNANTGDWIGSEGAQINSSLSGWIGGDHLLVSWMLLLGDPGMGGVGAWLNKTGYMGVQFEANDGTHYGWVHMTVYGEHPGMTLHSWAYESVSGEGIVAGAVPEPATALLAVIGGLSAWFLRRNHRASKVWKNNDR